MDKEKKLIRLKQKCFKDYKKNKEIARAAHEKIKLESVKASERDKIKYKIVRTVEA